MEGLWKYVYEAGQWFWQLPCVMTLLGIAEGCIFLWFIRPLEYRTENIRSNLLGMAAFLSICVYIQFQCLPVVNHCLVFLFLWTSYILLSRAGNWKNALFISSVFCLIIELAKLLIKDGPLAGLIAILLSMSGGSTLFNALLLILYLTFVCVEAIFIRLYILRHDRQNMNVSHMISLIFPLILYLLVRNMQFRYMGGDDSLWIQLQLVQIATAVCALIIIVTTEHFLSMQLERNELMKMEMLLRQQQQQYLVRKETIEAINHKYHDLKHYLAGIEALSRGETQEYVQAIRREIEPYERCQETGNEVLDILLTDQIRLCQEKHIRLVPYVDGRMLDFIHNLDLCAIFGNAMDNAVEAVERLSDEDLREINVKIGISDQMVIMRFHNYFDGTIKKEGKRLLTRKTTDENHGYGFENIRRLAEKYKGTAAYEINGQEFSLNVIIPLPTSDIH